MTIGTKQNICIGFYDSEGLTQPLCFVYPCVFSCPHGFESLLFSYETNRHPPLFIETPEKRELFGEKEQQRSA